MLVTYACYSYSERMLVTLTCASSLDKELDRVEARGKSLLLWKGVAHSTTFISCYCIQELPLWTVALHQDVYINLFVGVVCGVWCMVCGVWWVVCGVWWVVYGGCMVCVVCGVWCVQCVCVCVVCGMSGVVCVVCVVCVCVCVVCGVSGVCVYIVCGVSGVCACVCVCGMCSIDRVEPDVQTENKQVFTLTISLTREAMASGPY